MNSGTPVRLQCIVFRSSHVLCYQLVHYPKVICHAVCLLLRAGPRRLVDPQYRDVLVQVISDVVFCPSTNELVSVSKDGTLVFWDLLSGERSRTIDVSTVTPGRCTRLYLADSTYLVVDFDTPDSLAHVYDVITGRLLHACALPRLPSPMRGFVAGKILCRQKCLGNRFMLYSSMHPNTKQKSKHNLQMLINKTREYSPDGRHELRFFV